jgi:hypothetical protein
LLGPKKGALDGSNMGPVSVVLGLVYYFGGEVGGGRVE